MKQGDPIHDSVLLTVGSIGTPNSLLSRSDNPTYYPLASSSSVHIKSNHHTNIHVNQLGSRDTDSRSRFGRINDIDDNIRRFVNNMTADINFFRCISQISE